VIARAAGILGYLVAATLVLGYLGVGGYRAGFLWLALAIPVASTFLTWWLLRRRDTNTAVWCIAIVLIGVTAAAKLVDLAPESTARLDQRLGRLALPFYKTVRETRSGHGWCRPHCPRVERVYSAPDTSTTGALLQVIVTMSQQGLVPDVRRVAATRPSREATIPSHRHLAYARAVQRTGFIEVTVRLTATRPQPATRAMTR
jgi:hypothetical protein